MEGTAVGLHLQGGAKQILFSALTLGGWSVQLVKTSTYQTHHTQYISAFRKCLITFFFQNFGASFEGFEMLCQIFWDALSNFWGFHQGGGAFGEQKVGPPAHPQWIWEPKNGRFPPPKELRSSGCQFWPSYCSALSHPSSRPHVAATAFALQALQKGEKYCVHSFEGEESCTTSETGSLVLVHQPWYRRCYCWVFLSALGLQPFLGLNANSFSREFWENVPRISMKYTKVVFFTSRPKFHCPPLLCKHKGMFSWRAGVGIGGGSWEGPDGLLWHSKVAPSSVGSTRLYVLKDASTRPLTFKFNFLILSLIIQPDGSLAPLSCLRQHASRAYWTRSCGLACWV